MCCNRNPGWSSLEHHCHLQAEPTNGKTCLLKGFTDLDTERIFLIINEDKATGLYGSFSQPLMHSEHPLDL